MCALGQGALPEVSNTIEEDQNWEGKVHLEETLCDLLWVGVHATKRPNGNVELRDEDDDDEHDAEPRAPFAAKRLEGQLLNRVALDLPCAAEADVAQADGEPGEECRETRKRDEPVEDGVADFDAGFWVGCDAVDVGEGAESEDGDDGPQRARRLVDVGEDPGCVSGFGEGSKGTRAGINAGKTDGQDGDANGDVDEI